MKQVCNQCHTTPLVDRVYAEAEKVVAETNNKSAGGVKTSWTDCGRTAC